MIDLILSCINSGDFTSIHVETIEQTVLLLSTIHLSTHIKRMTSNLSLLIYYCQRFKNTDQT